MDEKLEAISKDAPTSPDISLEQIPDFDIDPVQEQGKHQFYHFHLYCSTVYLLSS